MISQSNMNSVAGISMTERKTAPIKVGLVQINNSFSGQSYLPYSVALLESYVRRHAKDPGKVTRSGIPWSRAYSRTDSDPALA